MDESSTFNYDDNHSIASTTLSSKYLNSASDPVSRAEEMVQTLKKTQKKYRFEYEEKFVEECMFRKDLPKYLISKKFALKYTNLLKEKNYNALTSFEFNNEELVSQVESGNLNLSEKKDYIKVSELTWRFLEKLYSAKPPLSESYFLSLKYPKKKVPEAIVETIDSPESAKKKSKVIKTAKLTSKEKRELQQKIVSEELKVTREDEEEKKLSAEEKSVIVPASFSNIPTVGLVNTSTYCFANSGIQCLISNENFCSYFMNADYARVKTKTIKKKFVILAFTRLLQEMSSSKSRIGCDHKEIRNIVSRRFDMMMHHDCQEFIRFFLSELQDELNPKPPKDYTLENLKSSELAREKYFSCHYSMVDKTFAGILKSEVLCHNCKNVSITYDPFLDLSLHFQRSSRKIDNMLEDFFSDEPVTGYVCEKCKKISKATKSTSIAYLPPVLMIHLMRISVAPRKQKINDAISYETNNFSLRKFKPIYSRYMSSDSASDGGNYSLKAIAIHMGSPDFGHYISICKRGSKWYKFDDSNVTPVSESEIGKNQAYILIYEKSY